MPIEKERIIFIGRNTGYEITRESFSYLNSAMASEPHEIVAVVVSDDCNGPSLKERAERAFIPVLCAADNNINDVHFFNRLKRYEPTILLTVQYPKIYQRSLLELPEKACLNVHRGWPLRGGSIDLRMIMQRHSEYRIILHHMDEGIDTGAIIGHTWFEIDADSINGYALDRWVTEKGVDLIRRVFLPILGKKIPEGILQKKKNRNYEGKWPGNKKIIQPEKMTVGMAERLCRALCHPRENGALLYGNGSFYSVKRILSKTKTPADLYDNETMWVPIQFMDGMGICQCIRTSEKKIYPKLKL